MWIWKYGEFEIYHSNLANCRRQEFGADYPVFWTLPTVDVRVGFYSGRRITSAGSVTLHTAGQGYLLVDGERYPAGQPVEISAGEHDFFIAVHNLTGLPAALLTGVVETDEAWYTQDIDGNQTPVGTDPHYLTAEDNPNTFFFSYKTLRPLSIEETDKGILYDYGKETFGPVTLSGCKSDEKITVVYGESKEEATDRENALVWEHLTGKTGYSLVPRAFRYILVSGAAAPRLTAKYEFIDLPRRGSFACDDETVNRIWEVSAYTFHLNAREIYLDGIKRDRWLWSGDAYQSYKVNKALFHSEESDRRTILALAGKGCPEHLNTITDYSFYWVLSLWEHYVTYGDEVLLEYLWPRAVERMEFAGKRVDENGFIIRKGGDWIFIDWADLDKEGPVASEQILYIAALQAMAKIAVFLGKDGKAYSALADSLREKLNRFFWDEEQGGYISGFVSGKKQITRHANILALLYHVASPEQRESILRRVIRNPAVPAITTPYFEGFELELMGQLGDTAFMEEKFHSYWAKMLELGATTIWEAFDPNDSCHTAMYGSKYGKSLCHAWGSTPVYLLARYFLGVHPTSPGEKSFEVAPCPGSFGWMKGEVPLRDGSVKIALTEKALVVSTDLPGGTLLWKGKRHRLIPGKKHRFSR